MPPVLAFSEVMSMNNLWQDLKYAVRSLGKSPGFAIIAVITLALGMAVNTTVFSIINGMILRPLPVPHPEQLTVLALQQEGTPGVQYFSRPDYDDVRTRADVFSDVIAINVSLGGLSVDGKGDHCIFSRVSGNYFTGLGVTPSLGRLIQPSEATAPGTDPVMVLGYSYWQKHFAGDRNVVGKHVELNGQPLTIIGVTSKEFHGTNMFLNMDAYVPLTAPTTTGGEKTVRDMWTDREQRGLSVMARLKPGISIEQAMAGLSVIAQGISREHPDVEKGLSFGVYPERLARPEPDPENILPNVALAFTVLAALVLLVGCFNIANVLLVRATVRQREMAIRAAIGAGRSRLVVQYLTESLLLAVLGGAAGLVLSWWAAGFVGSLPIGGDLPVEFNFEPDARVYLFTLAVIVVTGILVGILPAIRVARADVNTMLREGGRGSSDGPKRYLVRNTLVVAQLAGSMLLLIVAGLFVRSLGKAKESNLGFNPGHVLNIPVDVQQVGYKEVQGREFFKLAEDRLKALPGVTSVASAFSVPMGLISEATVVNVDGHPVPAAHQPPTIMYNMVSSAYFQTMQIPLVRGRQFASSDTEKAPKVAIINETMAKKLWPAEEVLGKRFHKKNSDSETIEVVGIVRDAKYKGVIEDPQPFFYVPTEQEYLPLRTFHLRTSLPSENLRLAAAGVIQQLAPGLPVSGIESMSHALTGINGFLMFQLGAQITATMGILGLVLSVVGVYSVVSYAAAQRTHEIGIRMALGASPQDILKMVLTQSAIVIGIGMAVGLICALIGTRAIATLLVGVSASDPMTFFAVVGLLGAVALVACWIPARRATQVSPLVALRYE